MNIEFINRVEWQGIIGSVRQYTIGTQKGFQLTVATNRVYRDKDGNQSSRPSGLAALAGNRKT